MPRVNIIQSIIPKFLRRPTKAPEKMMESLKPFVEDARKLLNEGDFESGLMEFFPQDFRKQRGASHFDTTECLSIRLPELSHVLVANGKTQVAIDVETGALELNEKPKHMSYPILMKETQKVIDKYNMTVAAAGK